MSLNNVHFVLAAVGNPSQGSLADIIQVILHSNVINFIIVVSLIIWIVKKVNLKATIANKQNAIKNQIVNSEEFAIKANDVLDEAKASVSNAEAEVGKILDEAKQVAQTMASKIKDEIVSETEELHKKATKTILSDTSRVKSEVSKDITKAAFIVAEEHIKSTIDDRLHKKYIDEFIDNLSNLKV